MTSGTPPVETPLDVARTLEGKTLLLIGCTGFVGKVTLSLLLSRYPGIGRIYALVRPGMGNTAADRFFSKVVRSPVFDPVRAIWGDGWDSFLREKVVPIAGDIGRPLCSFGDPEFADFAAAGGLDCIVNSAGLVSFTPSLESALRINTLGAEQCLETARRAGAALVHVSTCYVAGRRDGEVWEDEPVVGYFPRRGELLDDDFDARAEIADCQRIIREVRERAGDRAHISEFRERAAAALREQRRDPDDEQALRLAVARERKVWVTRRLTELGMERAAHWGWTNTYTYTKSLGEQIALADREVPVTIVRPAIVESALRYPTPGWNEGFNTTAPLVYMMLKGHRQIMVGQDTPLDIVPVDHVAAGIVMATAAVIARRHRPVYQLGSSDLNPVTSRRLCELTGLAVRRHYRQQASRGESRLESRLRARLEPMPVSPERFNRLSAPQFKRLADRLGREIDERLPRWGAPRLQALAERAKDELAKISEFTGRASELMEIFRPFTTDHDIVFRCDNIRALHGSLALADQLALRWDPQDVDWRSYWFDTHFPGLQQWVFPVLDDEFGQKPRSIYTYKDLLELFDAATKLHRHRVALRLLPSDEDADTVVYTYGRIQELAQQAAGQLRERGVGSGDHVMLMAENRPEWAIGYFGILKSGATVVPVDAQLSGPEVANLLASCRARLLVGSPRVLTRLAGELAPETSRGPRSVLDAAAAARAVATWLAGELAGQVELEVLPLAELLSEPRVSPAALEAMPRGESVASLIYTSGTTGEPKGVMLTHRNFTAMAAKLSSLFSLYRHDGLLSVLPLHHTFEFSAGLLMPLTHGASITYLEEVGPDGLSAAFREGNITALVGVPALWQLLHRRIFKQVSERGPLLLRAFEGAVELNRWLRARMPFGLHPGRLLFLPLHRKLGGRMRLLISGGSALAPEVMKSFRGLGFNLYEGYGMTEAAPVIAVHRPREMPPLGSVGRALPGIDLRIDQPDEHGVGEIVAKGPSVMKGYHGSAEATAAVLRDGWLHTGDLGRLDADGYLYIVGRKKEMILGPSGENVYPDELEELYGDSPYIKELSVVGLPAGDGELVAALAVPAYDAGSSEAGPLPRELVRELVREHVRTISARLPLHKRIKVLHLCDHELPRTATRKVKRREVVAELERLERAARRAAVQREERAGHRGQGSAPVSGSAPGQGEWVRDLLAQVSQKPRAQVTAESRLEELGFDSLMFTELGVALEAAGLVLPDPGELAGLVTVADVERFVAARQGAPRRAAPAPRRDVELDQDGDELHVPAPVVRLGRHTLRTGQRMLYQRFLDTRLTGTAFVPPGGGYIVAANHASHLDMGLVKHALGDAGELLKALAAKDYFFEDPVRRAYFENFTNLLPMERHGSLRESLELAAQVLRDGQILLIFPEGTRSETGIMSDFKPSLGFLALSNQCGILPMYLAGTHDAMPKGAMLPRRGAPVAAHIGPFLSYEALRTLVRGMGRAESYRAVATHVERIVRRLAPASHAWTLGASGLEPADGTVPRGSDAPAVRGKRPGVARGDASAAAGEVTP